MPDFLSDPTLRTAMPPTSRFGPFAPGWPPAGPGQRPGWPRPPSPRPYVPGGPGQLGTPAPASSGGAAVVAVILLVVGVMLARSR